MSADGGGSVAGLPSERAENGVAGHEGVFVGAVCHFSSLSLSDSVCLGALADSDFGRVHYATHLYNQLRYPTQ